MTRISQFLIFILSIALFSCEKGPFSGLENEQIQQYISSKNLQVTKSSPSGLQFILTKENKSGAALSVGQYIKVNYAGRLLSDKQFDAGSFGFTLGIGQVVRGFDEGISLMRVGEKATIIFPSNLGYGNRKQGDIPKNSPLVFDVEVISAQ